MARRIRIKSESGMYHVMLRGINKQEVFHTVDDYLLFLRALAKCKAISGFKLYAYCLMGNHLHLLLQVGDEPLDLIFKRLGDMFVYWYNQKYERSGAIFEGRYKSLPVDSDEYFITVLKYIHQNPVKAGIVKECSDYEFSSYNSYFTHSGLIDTGFALDLMSIDDFKSIHSEISDDSAINIDAESKPRLTDEDAEKIVKNLIHCEKTDDFKQLPKDMQIAYVRKLKSEGLSIRQICKMTGASQRLVQYC